MVAHIDWSRPWLAHLRPWRSALESGDVRRAFSVAARELNVCTADGLPIEFVDADDAGEVAYEAHIAATGRVPTCANLHDLFNALAWLAAPRTKAALNARQARAIAAAGIGATRGAVRDAATLIDENGLLLACDDAAVFDALAAHDWTRLLVDWRARWGLDIAPLAIGHALLDKLTAPFKAITAHVVVLRGRCESTAEFDACAAEAIAHAELTPRALLHLPVLGIPGWSRDNEAPGFYADRSIFRPAAHRSALTTAAQR
jgi:hypothetical protein